MKSLGRQSLSQRLHLDVPLCFGLLMLCGLGLVVLYSASGEDLSIVIRQATRMAVAFVFMFLVAQLSPTVIERWSIWIFIAGIAMLGTVLWAGYVGKEHNAGWIWDFLDFNLPR